VEQANTTAAMSTATAPARAAAIASATAGQRLSDAAFSGDTSKVDQLLEQDQIPIDAKDNVRN
jgi:hypothetical protein